VEKKTFSYGSGARKGLLSGKKATFDHGQRRSLRARNRLAALNFATPYLRAVLGFMGITDVTSLPPREPAN